MRTICKLEFLAIIFLSCTISNVTRVHSLPTHGIAYVPYSQNKPKIDGLWTTPTEWTDATMIKVENTSTGWAFYIGLKYNKTHIFVLLDFISDQTQSTHDFGGVFFDTKDDGGNLAQQDDYGFVITPGPPSLTSIFQGTGNGNKTGEAWTEILLRPYDEQYRGGFSGKNNPYESRSHRIMEFAISRKWFKEEAVHYGLYVFVSDRHSGIPWPFSRRTLLEWPIGAGGENMEAEVWAAYVPPAPERWGDLVLHEKLAQALATLDQIKSDYNSLSKRFNDLQTAYLYNTYLMYSLLATTIIFAAVTVYKTKLRPRSNKHAQD